MGNVLIVQTTLSDINEATEFAKKILESRLAACVQLSSKVQSMYRWKNSIEKEDEIIVTMKTLENIYTELEALIEKIHTYETPEILAAEVKHVGKKYLQWLNEEVVKG